ncbi:MAG TPA: hypothetical protein VIW80_00150 [Pyrinomonadaceae bacterium]
MRTLLLLSLLLSFVSTGQGQNAAVSDEGASVVVVDFKWFKSRQTIRKPDAPSTAPAVAMIPENKVLQRNERAQAPLGVRDPNVDTIDGRSAALEKNVQESRSPKSITVDGFTYQAKIRNASTKAIEIVFWEYQFKELSNPTNVIRRQFLCGVNIKPAREKELLAFSTSGPSDVISVESLTNKTGNLFEEKAVINRVEYADGSILQRKGWNFAEMKSSIERAIKTPWGAEMCRGI